MKKKILRQLIMLSKRLLYGFTIQLFLCTVIFANTGNAQRKTLEEVTLNVSIKENTLLQFFNDIESKTDFKFTYSDNAVILNQKISVDRKNTSLYDILAEVSKQAKVSFIQVNNNIHVKPVNPGPDSNVKGLVRSDDISVSGIITDENGEPLPGATITVQGTTTGTITDIDGRYSITVPEEASLVISYIGYQPKIISVGNQTEINIRLMLDASSLDEVIVTGYSSQARRNITSAVSVVDTEDLLAVPATNLAQQLQGRAAGVSVGTDNTPGGGVAVRVRGYGTLGNNDPLYIIDGVPTKGNLNTINQNDIESIQILKDASSASIYGSRAANGVIIITTKKGKAGDPKVTFDAYYGIQSSGNKLDLLNTTEYGQYLWQSKRNANVVNSVTGNPEHSQYGNGPEPVIPDYIIPDGAFEGDPRVDPGNYSYDRFTDPEFGQTKFSITRANKEGTNWMDEVFQSAPIQNYQLGISGGTEKGRYSFSTNYFDQQGILLHNGYKRYTLRANSEFTVKNKIRVGENIQIAYGQRQGNYSNNHETSQVSNTFRAQPIIPVYDIGGNFAGTLGSNLGNANNPVGQLYRNKDNGYKELRIFGNVFAEADLFQDLTFRTNFGIDGIIHAGRYFNPIEIELAHANNVNSLTEQRNYNHTWTWTNTLSYEKTIGEDHSINVFLGLESIEGYGNNLSTARQGYFAEILDIQYIDAGSPTTATNSGNIATLWSLFSYFGRVDYSFKDKFIFQGTVRRDASSRFLAATRYATFPAVSGGWRLSQESFMENISILSELKLRAGWGQTGNQEIGDFNAYATYHSNPFTSGYSITGSPSGYNQGFDMARFGNPNAKWETSSSINIGLDASFFDNQLEFFFDVYDRKTENLLYARAFDPRLGDAIIPAQNIASMQNRGIDLAVNYHGSINSGEFRYSINANFSTYRNKILALDPDNPDDFLPGFGLRTPPVTRSIVGRPLSSFYGYIIDGIMQSEEEVQNHASFPGYYDSDIYINGQRTQGVGKFKFRDINGDGVINSEDQTFIGNPHPDFSYGINLNLAYKNFDLTIFAQGVQGNDLFNHVRYWTDFEIFQGNRSKRMLYDSWRPDNPNAVLPILDANDAQSGVPSTYFVEDGSYMRLKNLQLGYTFPTGILSRIGLNQLRVYGQLQNLFTITNYSGLDPEVNLRNFNSGSDREIGVDQGVYPTPKGLIFGLSAGF